MVVNVQQIDNSYISYIVCPAAVGFWSLTWQKSLKAMNESKSFSLSSRFNIAALSFFAISQKSCNNLEDRGKDWRKQRCCRQIQRLLRDNRYFRFIRYLRDNRYFRFIRYLRDNRYFRFIRHMRYIKIYQIYQIRRYIRYIRYIRYQMYQLLNISDILASQSLILGCSF